MVEVKDFGQWNSFAGYPVELRCKNDPMKPLLGSGELNSLIYSTMQMHSSINGHNLPAIQLQRYVFFCNF